MARHWNVLTAVLLAFLCAAPTAAVSADATGETHTLRLTRPFEVGYQMHVRFEGSQETKTMPIIPGQRQVPQEVTAYVLLDAVATVQAVDERKQPTKVDYEVDECQLRMNGRRRTLAPKGSTLTATLGGRKTEFMVDGRPVSSQATEALRIIVDLGQEGMSHDEIAGLPAERRVGEEWEIDVAGTLAEIRGRAADPGAESGVSGKVSFLDVQEHGGRRCHLVDTEMTIRNWLDTMPPGFEIDTAEFTAVIRGLYPEDQRVPPLAESGRVELNAVLTGSMAPGQPRMKLVFDLIKRLEREIEPLNFPASMATVTEE